MSQHALGGKEKRLVERQAAVHGLGHARADAAALRMQQQFDVGMLFQHFVDVLRTNRLVHVAVARIRHDVAAAALPRYHRRQKLVRHKQNGLIRGNGLHHFGGVGRRADVIAFRLHRRRRIDVRHHHRARIARLPFPQFVRRDRGRKRTARAQIRQQHDLLRADDGRRLGHEVHAAEHDHVRAGLGRRLRKPQRIGHAVGHFLHLRTHVVMRQDDGVALLGQLAHARLLLGRFPPHVSVSSSITGSV